MSSKPTVGLGGDRPGEGAVGERAGQSAARPSDEALLACFDYWYELVVDRELRVTAVRVGGRFEQLTGLTAATLRGAPWVQLAPAHDLASAEQRLAEIVECGSDTRELRVMCLTGERWFEDRAVVRRGQTGQTEIVGVGVDITERKRREQSLVDIEMAFGDFVLSSPDWVFETDVDLAITFTNYACFDIIGVAPGDMMGRSLLSFMAPHDQAVTLAALKRALAGNEQVVRVDVPLSTSGPPRWFELMLRPKATAEREVLGVRGIGRDITVKHQEEQALRAAKRAAEDANRAKDEFLANISHELRTPLTAVLGTLDLVLCESSPPYIEQNLRIARHAGETLLSLINDLLDIAKFEAGAIALRRQSFDLHHELLATLQTLAARASKKGIELVYDGGADVPSMMMGDGARVRQVFLNLVGNAIKFTSQGGVVVRVRAEPEGERQVLLRCEVSDTGIGISKEHVARIFERFMQVNPGAMRGQDGVGLGLAITRRLIDLMGGTITVESEVDRGSTFRVDLRLERADDPFGPLIPEISRVLVLSSTRFSGPALVAQLTSLGVTVEALAGLGGLSAMLEAGRKVDHEAVLIDTHGDPATVLALLRGQEGYAGPIIVLRDVNAPPLPRAEGLVELLRPFSPPALSDALSPTRRAAGGALLPPPTQATLSVLVAEDNPVNQYVIRGFLRKLGHRVELVENGLEAVDAARLRSFDLILMDLHMPVLDGLDAARRIVREVPDAPPIYAYTASAQASDEQMALAAGLRGLLPKPLGLTQLAVFLDSLVTNRTRGR